MVNSKFFSHVCFLLFCPEIAQRIFIHYALNQIIVMIPTPRTQLAINNFKVLHFCLCFFVLLCIIQKLLKVNWTHRKVSSMNETKKKKSSTHSTHPLPIYVCSKKKNGTNTMQCKMVATNLFFIQQCLQLRGARYQFD